MDIKGINIVHLVVLSLLMASGGGIVRSIYFLVFTTFLLVINRIIFAINKEIISIGNIKIGTFLILFLLINTYMGAGGEISYSNIIILIVRIICLLCICSCITFDEFKKAYLQVMFFLAILSLICFGILLIFKGVSLPFTIVSDGIRGTFYHVYNFVREGNIVTRNSGIFWEPGVYQIYLNFGILLLLSSYDLALKTWVAIFVIFTITLLTTFSSMGYICYSLIILISLFNSSKKFNYKLKLFAIFFFSIFLVVEGATGVVRNKLIYNRGSFSSRHDDALVAFRIASFHPIWGTGIARDYNQLWYRHSYSVDRLFHGTLARSNGLGACLFTSGLPFTIYYLYMLLIFYKKLFNEKLLAYAIAFVVNVLFFMNEPIMFVPFWLSFFLIWKPGKVLTKGDAPPSSVPCV